jgi:hypothetical protein
MSVRMRKTEKTMNSLVVVESLLEQFKVDFLHPPAVTTIYLFRAGQAAQARPTCVSRVIVHEPEVA